MCLPLSFAAARRAAVLGARAGAHACVWACLCLAACGAEMVASPYPAARAIDPVEDDTGLQGTAIAGGTAGGSGSASGAVSGGTAGDGGDGGGGPQDGNALALGVQVSLQDAGRRALAEGTGGAAWVADLQLQASHYRLRLWPTGAAGQAAVRSSLALPPSGTPALILAVPRGAPLGVQLDAAVDPLAAGTLVTRPGWWGRVRLDALPSSPAEGAAAGEFEVHGPLGTLAGRFHAVDARP